MRSGGFRCSEGWKGITLRYAYRLSGKRTMSRADDAVSRFREGSSCAQSVASVFAPDLGLSEEQALRVSSGFGGGMGQTGGVCGVISGGIMAIGLRYGSGVPGDKEARAKTYAVTAEFIGRFRERHGSVACPDLLGCDLSVPEERERARRQNLTRDVCPGYIRDAVEILEELL